MSSGFLFLFVLLSLVLHNPLLAVIVIVIVYYLVDRRFIGLTPNLLKPVRTQMRISRLHREILENPHDAPARYDLARLYIGHGAYNRALRLLQELPPSMQEAADVQTDWGICQLHLGECAAGEQRILNALSKEPKLRYGEPYLEMAAVFAPSDPKKALHYLNVFQSYNASSCESEYRLAKLFLLFDNPAAAREALRRCIQTYRMLPRFRKRVERRWALLARWRLLLVR
ncbi:tetratricopeptide repeat protein [Alicyclobacillus cycloheptanicus]|uniref:Tetratricopeptide (TPR) repeat protein n=1 Tax=Alicyclobacillus cycloheptanicus TaxID=1457 RepID=A0ABT9XFP5_9BACL|nr:tetratricopeptide repeat protein [Alicyclobacillus cycloheptanicus]MDQ0189115.1 tetratricopeptide (TPR) repeat protein [Alicyclobacillus cycloheptanicus]WDM00245.1 tetratricopeptide repeat protein [Alicyclobacillus cycloheptanicus]